MNFDEAMDPLQMVSVEDAKRELMKHSVPSYIEGGFNNCYLYGEIEAVCKCGCGQVNMEEQRICQVINGEVYSNELLEWLGY